MSSIQDIVAAAKMQLSIETTNYDSWLRLRAQHAIRAFNHRDILIKKVTNITPDCDGRWELPDDFYRLIFVYSNLNQVEQQEGAESGIANSLSAGAEAGGALFYLDVPFLNSCGVGFGGFPGSYQINGNTLQFMGDFTNITCATLCYVAYNTHKNGEMKTKFDWEEAVMYFLCYNFLLAHPNQGTAWQVNEYRKLWVARTNKVNGDSQVQYFKNARPQMMEIMLSVITDKNPFWSI
jgi:hypothetical protein